MVVLAMTSKSYRFMHAFIIISVCVCMRLLAMQLALQMEMREEWLFLNGLMEYLRRQPAGLFYLKKFLWSLHQTTSNVVSFFMQNKKNNKQNQNDYDTSGLAMTTNTKKAMQLPPIYNLLLFNSQDSFMNNDQTAIKVPFNISFAKS